MGHSAAVNAMNYGRYLIRNRHGTRYYARVIIPKRLRSHFHDQWELRKSTMTSDLQQAKLFALSYYLKCQNLFWELDDMPSKGPSDVLILMEGLDAMNRPYKVDFDAQNNPEAGRLESEAVNALIAESKKERDEIVALHSNNPVLLNALLRIKDIDENTPSNPMPFQELVKKFIHDRQLQIRIKPGDEGIKQRTFDEEQAHVKFWRVFFKNRQVHRIKQEDITEVSKWLNYLPTWAEQKRITIDETIDLAQQTYKTAKPATPKRPKATYNKYANVLRLMLKKAKEIGAHTKDLSTCIPPYSATRQKSKEPEVFSIDDLKLIFSDYGKHFSKPSKMVSFEAKFWLPILGAFTGCRIEEMAQLTVANVKRDPKHNIDYLNISDKERAEDGNFQSTKNENSNRPVPIHPVVIKIGFLRYVAYLRKQTGGSNANLFNLTRASNGKHAGQFSKYFTRKNGASKGFIERCGVTSKGVDTQSDIPWYKSFHSFRHTGIATLREAREPLERIAFTFGHAPAEKFETSKYGKPNETDRIDQRYEVIKNIKYPGVPFNKIRWKIGLSSDAKGLTTISRNKK